MTELELITLKDGFYASRKTVNYDDVDADKANKAYSSTVKKYERLDVSGLVTLRTLRGPHWVLDKIVKV